MVIPHLKGCLLIGNQKGEGINENQIRTGKGGMQSLNLQKDVLNICTTSSQLTLIIKNCWRKHEWCVKYVARENHESTAAIELRPEWEFCAQRVASGRRVPGTNQSWSLNYNVHTAAFGCGKRVTDRTIHCMFIVPGLAAARPSLRVHHI